MKQSEIKVGSVYRAKVSGRIVDVCVDEIGTRSKHAGYDYAGNAKPYKSRTVYHVTNLATGRAITFLSASKFRQPSDGVAK